MMRYDHNLFNPLKFLNKRINYRRVSVVLAGIVVFVTTYALILPAIALEENKAVPEEGVFLESDAPEAAGTAEAEESVETAEEAENVDSAVGWEKIPSVDSEEEASGIEAEISVDTSSEETRDSDGDSAVAEPQDEDEISVEEPQDSAEAQAAEPQSAEDATTDSTEAPADSPVPTADSETAMVQQEGTEAQTEAGVQTETGTEEDTETQPDVESQEETEAQPEVNEEAEPDEKTAAEGSSEAKGDNYAISVTFDENAGLPAETELDVREIGTEDESYEKYFDRIREYVGEDAAIESAQFYDLTLKADGEEIEPSGKVGISMEYRMKDGVPDGADRLIVHFTDKGIEVKDRRTADEAGSPDENEKKAEEAAEEKKGILNGAKTLLRKGTDAVRGFVTGNTGSVETAEFETDSFSVYGVVYVVDFAYSVNGSKYECTIPGGGFISLEHLVRLLSISEEPEKFVSDVENVKFSSPELLSVSKAEEDTTVGAIRNELGLVCEYSDDLTEADIEGINSQPVAAGDWALISLKAFETGEVLTVSMKTGETFTIRLTDALDDPLGLDGKAYAIVNTRNNVSTAMKPEISGNRLQGQTVTLGQNGSTATCSDNADVWVFEYAGDGKYYIHSGDQYLKITGTNNSNWQIELVDRTNAVPITIVENENNGTYRFLNDNNISINNYGGVFWAGNWNNSDEQMSFRTPYDANKPAERPTEDTRAVGLTINLFDYGPDDGNTNLDHVNNVLGGNNVSNYWNAGINQYSDLKFFAYGTGYDEGGTCGINNFTGSSPNHKAAQGIVQTSLDDGYPALQNGQSLDYLFDMSDRDGKTIYSNVNHLFWLENGNYKYDSNESYAYYNRGTKDFKVYNTTFEEEGSTDTETFKVGFYPFNDYDERYRCIHGDNFAWNCAGSRNTHGVTDEVGHYNHHFGLTMTGTFEIVENQNMNFHFSGDDDMWVFVDDVLVLDIGGIHNPITGDIDFRTGAVTVSPNKVAVEGGSLAPDTIAAAFERAGKTWDGSNDTYHEIKVFYLERGGMYSNLEMEINLPLVPSGDLTFDKKNDQAAGVPGAKFQLFTDAACEHPLSYKSEPATAVSDSAGVVEFSGIPVGNYYMKEVEAPVGYVLDPAIYEVTIRDKNYPEQGESFIRDPEGNMLTQILNGKKQIIVTLEKEWAGGAPDGAAATFALKRLRSYEGDVKAATGTINVYTVASSWNIGTAKLQASNVYAGNTNAYVSWGYTNTHGGKNYRYRVDSGTEQTGAAGQEAEIYLPAGTTVNVYIQDTNIGTQWENYDYVNNINVRGTDPDNAEVEHVSVSDQEDPDFNSNPPTHVFPVGTTVWTYTFPAQDAEALRPDGLVETYKYYIEEVSHNPADWLVSFSNNALTESGTVTAVNYKNEVYVEKRWYDADGNLLDPQPADPVSVTLSSTNGGQITGEAIRSITAQNKGTWTVEDNAEKLYEAAETALAGYETTYSFKDIADSEERTEGGVHRGGTIYVNNRRLLGAIKLTKVVLDNGHTPETPEEKEHVNGSYIFRITSNEGVDPAVTKYVQIIVEDGAPVSYKAADTEESLETTEAQEGTTALVTGFLEGDYTIEEVNKNGLMLTEHVRGDGITDAINEDEHTVTVHVTAGDTDAEQSSAQATFTNTYFENDGPDKTTLDIVKTFSGITSLSELPDHYEIVIGYTLNGAEETIVLKTEENELNDEGIKIVAVTDGLTIRWHITNIPSEAGNFRIKEVNYDSVGGYDFTSAELDGDDITETAGEWHGFIVVAPTAHLQKVTSERNTSDSPSELKYVLEDGDILLSKLTSNEGTLVISKTSLNTLQREAVIKGWPQQGGFKDNHIHWFSIEEHPEGFGYGGKTVTFSTRESDGKTIVAFTSSAAAQEEVFAVSYDSHAELNNASLSNVYSQKKVTLDIVKVKKDDTDEKLEGAQFTICRIKDTLGANGIEYDDDESDPVTTGTNGDASFENLTEGYYEIKETQTPAGYIITGDNCFYIIVEDGVIHLLEKTAGTDPKDWDKTKTEVGNVTFTAAAGTASAIAQVENTPGVELPHTGGRGTGIFTILGSLLIAGAGLLLFRRRMMI